MHRQYLEIRMKAFLLIPLFLVSSFLISPQSVCKAQDFHPQTAKPYRTPVDGLMPPAFPLRELTECEVQGQSLQVGNVRIDVERNIQLSSSPQSKAKWNTMLYYSPSLGCAIYQGDLDNDGEEDLVILTFGGDSSGGYDTRLTVLMMNKNGMPTPWRVEGYFRAERQDVREISKGPDGNAYILDSISVGQPAWGGVSYGYRLFHPKNGQMEEVSGNLLGLTWPYLPKVNPNNEELRMKIASSSNVSSGSVKTTSSLTAVNQGKLSLVGGTTLPLPEVVVVDHADQSRTILFEPTDKDLASLTSLQYSIQFAGTTDRFEAGGPFLMWARATGR